jgi:hypothetical protein
MKTFFLLFSLVLSAFIVKSQVVIEEADLMQPGDTFLIHVDLSPVVVIDLTPGEDLSWDFLGLNNDQTNFACYPPSDDLEFIDEFPLSETYTYGPGYIYAGPGGTAPMDNWGYLMTFTNSNGLFVEGFYSDYGMGYRSTFNTPAEMLMFTPCNYSNEQAVDSHWEVTIDLSDETPFDIDTLYRRQVSKTLNADAWGSIITDYGTFDVLRIHETGISIDSAFGIWNSTVVISLEYSRDTINNYYFWAKEIRNPVLTLHCDYEDNIERIDYVMGAIYASSNIIQANTANAFPNPATNKIELEGFNGLISIFNVSGEVVMRITDSDDKANIDISTLKNGLYLMKDTKGNSAKFVKQ